jgi:hypothetical protein
VRTQVVDHIEHAFLRPLQLLDLTHFQQPGNGVGRPQQAVDLGAGRGRPEQVAHHRHRERVGELVHHVNRPAVAERRLEEAVHQPLDRADAPRHAPRGEVLLDHPQEDVVVARDRPAAPFGEDAPQRRELGLSRLRQRIDPLAFFDDVHPRVLQARDDVVVARDDPGFKVIVEIDRTRRAHFPQDGMRVEVQLRIDELRGH